MAEDALCRNGLHPIVSGARTCLPCKRMANRRYDTSSKGLLAHRDAYRRYRYSTKGMLASVRSELQRALGRV